jgi:hypothetical protein
MARTPSFNKQPLRKSNETVTISVELKHETRDAYLVTVDGDNEVWVPKSYAQYDPDAKELELPEWAATSKGLV